MRTVKFGSVELGRQFDTKTVVPITAETVATAKTQSEAIIDSPANIAEWRLDYLSSETSNQTIYRAVQAIKMNLKSVNKALLMTVRTKAQGGFFPNDPEAYLKQYQFILKQELADAIDVEFSTDLQIRKQILKASGLLQVPVVLSYHNFAETPSLDALKEQVQQMAELDVAILKIAVMPNSATDILTIFQLADWAKINLPQPLAIMGMGQLGRITRVSGNIFPSAFTFATLDEASAPGQMPLDMVQAQLNLFND